MSLCRDTRPPRAMAATITGEVSRVTLAPAGTSTAGVYGSCGGRKCASDPPQRPANLPPRCDRERGPHGPTARYRSRCRALSGLRSRRRRWMNTHWCRRSCQEQIDRPERQPRSELKRRAPSRRTATAPPSCERSPPVSTSGRTIALNSPAEPMARATARHRPDLRRA